MATFTQSYPYVEIHIMDKTGTTTIVVSSDAVGEIDDTVWYNDAVYHTRVINPYGGFKNETECVAYYAQKHAEDEGHLIPIKMRKSLISKIFSKR